MARLHPLLTATSLLSEGRGFAQQDPNFRCSLISFFSNWSVIDASERKEWDRGKRTDDTVVENSFNMSHCKVPSAFIMLKDEAEWWRKDEPRENRASWDRHVADLLSDRLWPISHIPLLILPNAFRCIVYVPWAGSRRRFDVPNSITVMRRHKKVCWTRRGWNYAVPSDTFLQTGYASDAIWWMCWQQLWCRELKELHGSCVGS